jgi:two-component system, cell cycle sensor histidine kinase and response regulator CckA
VKLVSDLLRGADRDALIRAVVDASRDALLVYDHRDRPVLWNSAMLAIAGVTAEQIASSTPDAIWDRLVDLLDDSAVSAISRERHPDQVEETGATRDTLPLQDGRVFERTTQPFDLAGQRGRIEWYRDVTEFARSARRLGLQRAQAQKMKAIGRLAGGVAHDFNNLLTAITCHAELLGDELGNHSGVQEIIAAASGGARLTRQLLAFSRQQHLRPSIVDVTQIVRGITGMLRHMVGAAIRLEVNLPDSLPVIRVDPGQFEQILVSLVANARDAMPNGGRVAISAERLRWNGGNPDRLAMPPGEYVAVRVDDTGTGIADDALPHVFEPFFSLKDSASAGLGLATVYGIVKQSGGFVWVDSRLGRGSTFSIEFPVSAAALDETGASVPGTHEGATGRRTILVAEDQDNVRRIIVRFLYGEGHRIIEASSGAEALRLVETAASIDLLVTDVSMPHMTGPELSQRLRERWPGLRTVYTSGFSNEHLEVAPDALFVPKPFNRASLVNKVREALSWTQA